MILIAMHLFFCQKFWTIPFRLSIAARCILPKLELAKLDHLQWPARVFSYGDNPALWSDIFSEALQGRGIESGRIGVEPRQMRVMKYQNLRMALAADYGDGSLFFSALRAVKDAAEIADMRKAVQIAEQALEATLSMEKIGVTEAEIASELFVQLMRNGSEADLPFNPILAAGPNGANQHSQPSGRSLAEGDLLINDWGASYNGYASDITRTFAVDKLDGEAEEIHKIVQAANQAGRESAAVGVSCLEVGHAFTVEPGIYLKGRNGVRIEDDVVVTENGAESLSTMSREIRAIG